jgi:NADPH-dependent curcumin reductase CurA
MRLLCLYLLICSTGLTAYGSLHEIGRPKKGDVILVSSAAGAVGQAVGQIAVRGGLHVRTFRSIIPEGSSAQLNFHSGDRLRWQ